MNQEAIDWARGEVEKVAAKYRRFANQAIKDGDPDRAMLWRRAANHLQMDLIGGQGCVITPFDRRRAEFDAILAEECRP